MHELPVIDSILKIVLRHAVENNVNKVVAVHLQVGEMSDLEDKWMQQYFDHLSKGGVAEGAALKIERIPVVLECSNCGMSYAVDMKEDQSQNCPDCGGSKNTMVSGREYFIKHLEAM